MTLRKNSDKVKAYLGNAIDLHKFKDNTFDIVLLKHFLALVIFSLVHLHLVVLMLQQQVFYL